jgi:hypothetical protein
MAEERHAYGVVWKAKGKIQLGKPGMIILKEYLKEIVLDGVF